MKIKIHFIFDFREIYIITLNNTIIEFETMYYAIYLHLKKIEIKVLEQCICKTKTECGKIKILFL